jgi:tetratricopeptide (TPR) repeat protein
MARAEDAVSCPSCGARNKAKWEFCARCGESLASAPAAVADTDKKSRKPNIEVHAAEQVSPWNGVWATVFLLLFLGTALAAVRIARTEGPAPLPDPAAFTFPTQPPAPLEPPEPVPADSASRSFEEGRQLLREGAFGEAAIAFARAVGDRPESARYQWAYGEALVRSGDRESGLSAMGEAVRLDGSFRLEYVRALEDAGRFGQAASESEILLEEQPDRPEVLTAAGRAFAEQRNYDRALPLLERAVELQPLNGTAIDNLGRAAYQSGDLDKAVAAFASLVANNPRNHNAREALASTLLKQGKAEQAVATVRSGIALDPRAPELQRRLGEVLEGAGRPAEAAAAYREYARLAPRAPDAAALSARAAQLSGGTGS